METFEVDLDPAQIVRWVIAEHAAAPSSIKTSARCATEVREIEARGEYHLGDAERDELSEVATIATLEIVPAHERGGWVVTVTVEDDIGPRPASDRLPAEAEQQIDLGTFYSEFIRPERGVATAVAAFDGPAARRDLTHLLEAIERNRHAGLSPAKR